MKSNKRNNKKCTIGNIPYITSAYLVDIRISLEQVKVDDKSNEITVSPELLEILEI